MRNKRGLSRNKLALWSIAEYGGAALKGNPQLESERTVEEIAGADKRLEGRYA